MRDSLKEISKCKELMKIRVVFRLNNLDNKKFSSGFNSNSGVNYGGGPKFNLPKIELKNFDGTKVFTLGEPNREIF
jgi:hypothetical protein